MKPTKYGDSIKCENREEAVKALPDIAYQCMETIQIANVEPSNINLFITETADGVVAGWEFKA